MQCTVEFHAWLVVVPILRRRRITKLRRQNGIATTANDSSSLRGSKIFNQEVSDAYSLESAEANHQRSLHNVTIILSRVYDVASRFQ